MAEVMKAEDHRRWQEELLGWRINVVSYKLGDRYYCAVDNVEPGALIARGEGRTRKEAEGLALEQAREVLARTRRFLRPA